jgi:hypothetical protein
MRYHNSESVRSHIPGLALVTSMTAFQKLKARVTRGPMLAALFVIGTAGGFAAHRYMEADCCAPGSPCCHPGAACCHHKAKQ